MSNTQLKLNETSLVLQQPEECKALEQLKAEIQEVADMAMLQKVGSTETKDAALSIGGKVKQMRKALDDRRREITDPMSEKVKQIIAFARSLDAPLGNAELHIRGQLTDYARAIAEEQRKEEARIAREKAKAEEDRQAELKAAAAFSETMEEHLEATQVVEEKAKDVRIGLSAQSRQVKAQGVKGTTEEWKFEIVDPSLVPEEYWIIDESLLRNAVKVQKKREIPGLRIFSETGIRMGRF